MGIRLCQGEWRPSYLKRQHSGRMNNLFRTVNLKMADDLAATLSPTAQRGEFGVLDQRATRLQDAIKQFSVPFCEAGLCHVLTLFLRCVGNQIASRLDQAVPVSEQAKVVATPRPGLTPGIHETACLMAQRPSTM